LLIAGYRHVPLVDLQGEKFLYSTLFVKINWSSEEVAEKELTGKAEKRTRSKGKLTKLDRGSPSGTSIESKGSVGSTSTCVDEVVNGQI
jgi:hypothetical protein